jgi:hypothetical protein
LNRADHLKEGKPMAKRKAMLPKAELTLEQRRIFLNLSVQKRRREMEKQAARMVRHYQADDKVSEREKWQGGDLVDLP